MIALDDEQWDRLYREVLVSALRRTHTKDPKQEWTRRQQACEATQRAFERCLRLKPPDLTSLDAVRLYLLKAVRSELSNVKREDAARAVHEAAAGVEDETLGRIAAAPAEVIHLDEARARRNRLRAAEAIQKLRQELTEAKDDIALGTIECIEKGMTRPAEQAVLLKCSIDDIHNARRRRKWALAKILAEMSKVEENE